MSGALVVLSREGLTLAEAMAPGRLSVLMPVPAGEARAAFKDPHIGTYLDHADAVLLKFARECDAHEFERLRKGASIQ